MNQKGVILITGASRGVGEKVARTFADDNFDVVAVSRHITTSAFFQSLKAGASSISCHDVDVTCEKDVKELIHIIEKEHEHLDILVNNAGGALVKPFYEYSLAEWNEAIALNLTSMFLCTKYALPLMKRNVHIKKHIFNMLSIASETAFPEWSSYCAAKFGALGFTESIRKELSLLNIRVTGIVSGATDTALWDSIPGTWNKKLMLDPQCIADVIKEVYHKPEETVVEKIVIMPKSGIQ